VRAYQLKSKTEKLDLKVLYVEDEEVVRNTIYEMLRRRVKNVIIAEDGAKGLEKYLLEEDGADDFLDIVALGLIGDMADIRDLEVQYLIRKGIENIKNDFFMTIVKENFNINENKLSPTVLSFSIIPMINACTRVATFEEMQCITNAICNIDNGEDYEHTFSRGKRKGVTIKEDIYQHAHRVAQKVKARQDSIVNKAFLGSKRPLKSGLIELLEARDVGNKDNKIIVVDVTDYIENFGLSGLLANKIMAQYDKPTLVLHRKDDEYRGSGRGNQIPMLRTRLKESKIVKFAEGHEPAFGVRIDMDKTITEINDGLNDYFNSETTTDVTSVDFIIDNNDIDNYLLKDFEALEEFFGTGLKPPLIYIENVLIKTNTINTGSKSNLLKFKYNDVDFVKFKMSEAQLEDLIPWDSNVCYNVLCTPNLNDFNGKRNMQLVIDKIEVVELYTGEEKKEEDISFEW
jgi:single-stranded-DNA-specific exonuclease